MQFSTNCHLCRAVRQQDTHMISPLSLIAEDATRDSNFHLLESLQSYRINDFISEHSLFLPADDRIQLQISFSTNLDHCKLAIDGRNYDFLSYCYAFSFYFSSRTPLKLIRLCATNIHFTLQECFSRMFSQHESAKISCQTSPDSFHLSSLCIDNRESRLSTPVYHFEHFKICMRQ